MADFTPYASNPVNECNEKKRKNVDQCSSSGFTSRDEDYEISSIKTILPENYNKLEFSPSKKGELLVVKHSLHLESITDIKKREMEVHLTLWHGMNWQDYRLPNLKVGELHVYHPESVKYIFVPYQVFRVIKSMAVADLLTPIASLLFSSNHTVTLWIQYYVVLFCPMDFRNYPMDVQVCNLTFNCKDKTINQLTQEWNTISLTVDSKIEKALPEYSPYFNIEEPSAVIFQGYTFSSVQLTVKLRRNFKGHMLSVFFPSVIFELLSWLTLFIPSHYVQPRITLAITTLLTIITLSTNVQSALPPMDKAMRAIDLWFMSCLMVTFCVLLETVVIVSVSVKYGVVTQKYNNMDKQKYLVKIKKRLDTAENVFTVLLLAGVIVFNITFWSYYLTSEAHAETRT
ncbi:Glycine receptor subunit alpha-2 [Nymphon striatum]|nr:Glycine receptor subunit alpha-2 [Nymphon striatum]